MDEKRPLQNFSMDNLIDEMKFRGAKVLHSFPHDLITLNERAIIVVIEW